MRVSRPGFADTIEPLLRFKSQLLAEEADAAEAKARLYENWAAFGPEDIELRFHQLEEIPT